MTRVSSHIFWPHPIGPYEAELQRFFAELEQSTDDTNVLALIQQFLDVMPHYLNADTFRLRYRAYLHVMQDLLRQGWKHECRQGRIFLHLPEWVDEESSLDTINEHKNLMRELLNYERLAQLETPSVRHFIQYMERPRLFNEQMVSVLNLFADGTQFAQDLESLAAMDISEAQETVCRVIQPYLQLVSPKKRCEYTGLKLQDIWRYIRHTWAIPYKSTPGRNMFYLIRDAARDFHPIIGIAGLGNSIMQITDRDNIIGWTPVSMYNRIRSDEFSQEEAASIAHMFMQTLQATLDDVATTDLVEPHELEQPTPETLDRLDKIAKCADKERIGYLKELHTLGKTSSESPQQLSIDLDGMPPSSDRIAQLKEQASAELFRSKRAKMARALLATRKTLLTFSKDIASVEGLRKFIRTSEGQQTVRTLLRENKKRKVGINMMDLIVCGAVPPYTFLLGGKLVAMIMASPQIVYDYHEKYKNAISTIASKMKQEPVIREPKLVFLGTTSLYQVGSSQYNRLVIPLQNNGDKISYKKYGKTVGFGTVHFSAATIAALDELYTSVKGATLINNRFGEGINPKLRRIRAGLSAIGLENSDFFVNHHSKRIVYGVVLGKRTYEFLRGETDNPEFFFDVSSPQQIQKATEYITHTWATRWLLMRIRNHDILESVSSFSVNTTTLSQTLSNNGAYNTNSTNGHLQQEVDFTEQQDIILVA